MSQPDTKLQPEDRTEIDTTVQNILEKKAERRRIEEDLSIEAQVRDLLHLTRELLVDDEREASRYLGELHYLIRNDDDLADVLDRTQDVLEETDGIDEAEANQVRAQFRRQRRYRDDGRRPRAPKREYTTLFKLAKALGYVDSVVDMTPYVPVSLEPLPETHGRSVDDPTPIGRRRLPKGTQLSVERAEVEISHKSCDHIMAVAKPRQGKDSTLVSIGKNLQEEHGYKFISIYDDGRMETPMTAIPNDDPQIIKNLDQLGQSPEAMDVTVYVPAGGNVPDKLPANFETFTWGIDSLTPKLLLRLAGINKSDDALNDRISRALEMTLENSGEIPELVTRLQALAQSQEVTIEWTEVHDEETGDGVETKTAHYEMGAEKALKKAAKRVVTLAQEGVLASAGADTNVDMKEIIRDQESGAVLCCSFMEKERLKYTIIDLWLRRIHYVRDNYPRLPRVVVEVRELKNLAPSKIGNVWYRDAIGSLQQTFVFLASQGGSRRILLLASTQKWNDVAKSVRNNFGIKVLLQLSPDEIDTLDDIEHFSDNEEESLAGFPQGWGMVIKDGEKYYPIQFRGAPCGLGLGDQHWLDRYGKARGARVLGKYDTWEAYIDDTNWWVHVPEAEVYPPNDGPTKGEFYSEWFLLDRDFPDDTEPADVDEDLVEEVLAERRDHPLKTDISLEQTNVADQQRTIEMRASDEARRESVDGILKTYDLPSPLRTFLVTSSGQPRKPGARQKMYRILEVIDGHDIETYSDFNDDRFPDLSKSTVGNYLSGDGALAACVDKSGDALGLTPVGRKALNADWGTIAEEMEAVGT